MGKYMLLKIKPGKRDLWLGWCDELMTMHKVESLITLEEECLIQERCLIFGEGDNSYVVYKHLSEIGKNKKTADMSRDLNVKHFKMFHECLEKVKGGMIVGYDFNRN